MKALIVDDEPLARLELRRLLAEHPVFTALAEAGDVQEALELTRTYKPAVVFLDVQLRGESGFDYLDRMDCAPPRLVLVTAFEHYAIKAFERARSIICLNPSLPRGSPPRFNASSPNTRRHPREPARRS
jgi:two-component system, LytTR family, response regulator